MSLRTLTLSEFGTALAAKSPVPGGGSVAAVTVSHAAALVCMVLEFTLGKPAYAAHEESNAKALARARDLRQRALELADADAQAYGELNSLWKLPKDAAARVQAWDAAVQAAIDAPQAILDAAAETARLAAHLSACTNPNLASDLAIALDLARVAARAAAHNVQVNLPSVQDAAVRARFESRMHASLAEAGAT
ncbi:MAG: cyclodeaminase/cyclohydrolase family protein [Phycisphaerae bacterium]|nr:cyclodeaminase/cyclohydrolase family protein [Phycisphaerae bacterium]